MNKRLGGKVALVTGCGSGGPGWGNGKAISMLFAREGACVLGCDINLQAAQNTQALVRGEHADHRMEVLRCDVSDSDQVVEAVEACMRHFGRIDILVNNVGLVEIGGPVDYPLERWKRVMDINITSMFLTCKQVIPHMLGGGGGSIVNIGSIAGVRYTGVPYISYYASKAAVLGLSRAVAMQYAADNIRSNVVMPGLMNTPMIVEPLKDAYGDGQVEAMIEKRNSQCPTGRMGDAWDTANMVLFLASDESRYVTAGEFLVDGGITAKYV